MSTKTTKACGANAAGPGVGLPPGLLMNWVENKKVFVFETAAALSYPSCQRAVLP
jgi:hypothetical protein